LTLHGGPVLLRPVRATPSLFSCAVSYLQVKLDSQHLSFNGYFAASSAWFSFSACDICNSDIYGIVTKMGVAAAGCWSYLKAKVFVFGFASVTFALILLHWLWSSLLGHTMATCFESCPLSVEFYFFQVTCQEMSWKPRLLTYWFSSCV